MSALGNVILTLIATEGGSTGLSGYALSILLKKPAARFWHATHTQIYAELERLSEDGSLTYQVKEQDGKPDKKIYTLTEQGYKRLKLWINEPGQTAIPRDETLMKAMGIWLTDAEHVRPRFLEEAKTHQLNIEQYQEFLQYTASDWEREGKRRDTPTFGRYIVLRYLLTQEQNALEWCNWVLQSLT